MTILRSGLFAAMLAAHAQAMTTLINFDTAGNWSSSGSLTSYLTSHVYAESGWTFTGGPALRETAATQDGYPRVQGTHAWRLRDAAVTWTATYTQSLSANEFFSGFGFDARRWDGTPSPAYAVDFSFNGGSTWSPFTTVNNAALDNLSAWKTFTKAVTSATGLAANQFVVRFSATAGERIMVDNFTAEISTDAGGGEVAAPTGVSATANGQTAVDIIWTLNAAADPVLVARSADGSTGTPADGTAYAVGQTVPGGGTVVYAGSGASFADAGLTPGAEYTYTVWSVDSDTVYSAGVSDSAVTAGDGSGLRVFHMNDVHSRLTPHDYDVPETNDVPVFEKVGGAAFFAAKMLELKSAHPGALILDAGDSSEGSPLGDLRGNGGLIDFYNLLDAKLKGLGGRGIDAAVVGNHDVRFKAMLDNMKTNAAFPFISMNILNKATGLPYFQPYVTVTANGQKVGILGYTTDTSSHLGPDTEGLVRVAKCGWDDAKAEIKIKAYVDELRTMKHCDRVVLLIHVGLSRAFSDDQNDDEYQLVKDDGVTAPPELVVSGHWHTWTPTAWQPAQLNYKTVSAEAASYMQYIGEVQLNAAGRYANAAKHVIRNADITPDADVEALLDTLLAEYEAGSPAYALDQVIGYSGVDLRLNKNKWWTHDEYPWAGDNTAGAWISDAMQWYVESQTSHGCDLALQSGGGVRRDNAAGPLTYLEIYETYPWQDDNMVLVEATGREIWEFIENDFVGTSISKGWEVFADDGVITDIKKDGLSIDLDATFNVVISDYMYNHDNDTIVGGWGDASPTPITHSIRQSVIDYTSQFDATHPMDVPGPRYRLNVGHSGRFQAVVTMVDDVEDQPYYEAVFVRLLSATPDTVARRGGYVDETLVNEDGSINASHEFAEGMLYRSHLGFKDGLLTPGTLLNIQVEAGFHGGNPQWIDQSGILADGVEFDIAGTNVSLAYPDYKASVSEFWNEEYENRFVRFEAVKVGASQVRDRLGQVITVYAPGAFDLLALPGSVGDLLALTGVQTYRYSERRFRCAGAAVLEVAPVEPDYTPYSSVNALTGEVQPGYRLTATATDATQETQATLLTVHDTYVTDGYPTYTNGHKTALYLQSASTSANAYGDERIWTRFDVGALPAGAAVTSARLRLYCYGESASNSIPADVLACADDTWTEGALNWNTQPALGAVLAQTILDGSQRYLWYEWDVTPFVAAEAAGDGLASLVVKAHEENSVVKNSFTFDAKEYSSGSMGPFLQVEFTGGAVTGGTVTNVTFYYRYSADNRNWSTWAEAGSDSAEPWGVDFPFAEGFGRYEFCSVAVDNTGHVEDAPRLADASIHYREDADGDTIPDVWERAYFGSTAGAHATSDWDGDGVKDKDERLGGLNPRLSDSDGDLVDDGMELALLRNPLSVADRAADTDGDGRPDVDEIDFGSQPHNRASFFQLAAGAERSGALPVFALDFTALSGHQYIVQQADDLKVWHNGAIIDGSNALVRVEDDMTATRRFFRVRAARNAGRPVAKLCVLSDPHYFPPELSNINSPDYQAYLAQDRKLITESHAILQATLAAVTNERPDVLLVSGDLTKDGEWLSHVALTNLFAHVEAAGIAVIVTPGNHDINNTHAVRYTETGSEPVATVSAAEFAELYAEFGFGEALSRDRASLSFVTAPASNLWVLSLDSCRYTPTQQTGGEVSSATLAWMDGVLAQAAASNATVFAMMHHGVVPHYAYQTLLFPDYVVANHAQVAERLIAGGVGVVFTGHYHANDVARYASTNSYRALFDIETGSTVTWPCPYRVLFTTADGSLRLQTKHLDAVSGVTDFQAYAHEYLVSGLQVISKAMLMSGYGVPEAQAEMLAPALAASFAAHYAGDEGEPDGYTAAVIAMLGASPDPQNQLFAAVLLSLWNDPEPADNRLRVNVCTGGSAAE